VSDDSAQVAAFETDSRQDAWRVPGRAYPTSAFARSTAMPALAP
jgi:hypothetical protein